MYANFSKIEVQMSNTYINTKIKKNIEKIVLEYIITFHLYISQSRKIFSVRLKLIISVTAELTRFCLSRNTKQVMQDFRWEKSFAIFYIKRMFLHFYLFVSIPSLLYGAIKQIIGLNFLQTYLNVLYNKINLFFYKFVETWIFKVFKSKVFDF